MEAGGARTVCILRRMKRESLGHFIWNEYNPSKALPEELRFDLLDENERQTGQLVCNNYSILKGVEFSTPWGPAIVNFSKGGFQLSLGGKELAHIVEKGMVLKKGLELAFLNGVKMGFKPRKGFPNDVEFSDGVGSVGIFEESGVLPAGHPGLRVQMTKEEIKRLPRRERPRSIESRDYVQFRVMTWGKLPVDQEQVVAALIIFACFGRLIDEVSVHS